MLIELLRHGECADNAWLRGRTDSALSVHGRAQMESNWPLCAPSKLISSPALRCAEFVEAHLQTRPVEFSSPVFVDAAWQERDFGRWDGLSYECVQAHYGALLERYLQNPFATEIPAAEPYADFKARIHTAWQETLQQALAAGQKHVLIVTHGGPMRLVLQSVLGLADSHLFNLQIGYGCRVALEVTATPDGPFCQLQEIIQAEKPKELRL